ncbi:hypothetical protein J3Q64DRAFT_1700718 [Phycomyces blakesleeanus]|uniref:Uncharacterized protein n=2 Tax=Phycomyces blakesleeanus TaxID=4837 RepID=A0A167MKE2_PHYB8|nr:hypothetical protein PHYBLDRAFT_169352 [Phycomyces blakesleeanus NRRL 1555(-)]OAD73096.1 hypothetical protein PHYBLDRAFT_169352 [Phycomyces blakesleeanus NRRL 1555(-)]|eukprot:XP_018291136.1 hypothetical protein PHYBLDRAFT_169352 [Phycomyces blakesleeanus NRRL 1555(-)]
MKTKDKTSNDIDFAIYDKIYEIIQSSVRYMLQDDDDGKGLSGTKDIFSGHPMTLMVSFLFSIAFQGKDFLDFPVSYLSLNKLIKRLLILFLKSLAAMVVGCISHTMTEK